ncbi:hypothetical protein Tco_1401690 [Tanacetum coccineum]
MVFYQMDTEEVSDRFVAPCFVNGLEAYDGEINLGVEENMISNEYVVKLCFEHEVKRGNKVVKKELIVAQRGEINFVKFIINLEEDDVEPGVIFETKEEEKSKDDWDHLLDFNIDDIPLLDEGLLPFVCKMGKSSHNNKRVMENLNFFYQDIGTTSSSGGHLTQEEASKEALAIRMSRKFALLEEERPIIETMTYHDKYKKILDEVWKDKVELDGKIVKKEEEAVKRIKGEALKEKDDPGAFIFPIRLEGQLGREDMKKVDRGITMINHTQAEAMGILTNVLCQVGVTTLIAKFLILDILIDHDSPIVVGRGFLRTIGGIVNTPERLFSTFDGFCHQTFCAARSDVMRNAESDSDDEEEYQIKRNKFGASIYGPKPAPYSNCNDPAERSLAIQTITNPFQKISVWKKAVSFLGSLPVPLKNVNWKPDYKGSYTKEEEATGQWRTEIRLTDPYRNIYLQRFTTKKTDMKLLKYHKLSDIMSPNLWEHTMMRPDHHDPNALDNMKPWKRYCFHKFTMSSCYGKDVTEMQSLDLCHEFYSTCEFDEVCADDELQTKKIIKFRLGGRAHSLTLLEFARRLGLYHVVELEEYGFNVYFEGGLRSDEHFNAQEYWLSISREENLGLSKSHTSTIWNLILRVIHKMITYGLCQRTTGYDKIKKNDLWLLSMFDSKHQNGYANVAWLIARVLTEDVVRSLSASIYCRDLDTTPLRDLIDSEGKLIPEDPQPGVPRVGIPIPPRASMQDLYDMMGRMEIRQEAIERMEYRQSYH